MSCVLIPGKTKILSGDLIEKIAFHTSGTRTKVEKFLWINWEMT